MIPVRKLEKRLFLPSYICIHPIKLNMESKFYKMSQQMISEEKQIIVSLPDGSKRELPAGSTGMDLAESISKSLAKVSVAIEVDGQWPR